jgi:hypothetical protein
VRQSNLGKKAVLGIGGVIDCLGLSDISDKIAQVGGGCRVVHFCQKALGAEHFGVVTIRIGFLRCPKIDRSRLQSVEVSGIYVRSQV